MRSLLIKDLVRALFGWPLSGDIAAIERMERLKEVGSRTEEFCRRFVKPAAPSSYVTATELYERYCDWIEAEGCRPASLPKFATEATNTGLFEKERIGGRVSYRLKHD